MKPENLMVTSDGYVKILDFWLAKLLPQPTEVGSEMTTLPRGTREGVLLGTVQYMSPEQAASRPVDYRSDQFTLGSILHEMATGKLAFQRETVPQTLSAIIEQEPEFWSVSVRQMLAKRHKGEILPLDKRGVDSVRRFYKFFAKNSLRLFLMKNVQPSTQLSLLNSGISSGKLS